MTIFVNSSDNNFYRKVYDELDAAQSDATAFIEFQQTGVLIGKVDESKWTVSDFQRVSRNIQDQVKNVRAELAQQQSQDLRTLAQLWDMLQAFEKVCDVANKLYSRTYGIAFAHNSSLDTLRTLPENAIAASNIKNLTTNNEMALSDLTKNIGEKALKIIAKAEPFVDWKQQVYESGKSFLTAAISHHKKGLALSLIESGIDLEFMDSDNRTALMEACVHGNLDVVCALLLKGARVNNDHYTSALQHASDCSSPAVVETLLSFGADVNHEDSDHRTPLVEALESGREDLAQVLLAHNADPNKGRDKSGNLPLHIAVENDFLIVEDLLRAQANPNIENKNGNPALFTACGCGRVDMAEVLLKHGADIHKQNRAGDTLLSFAIAKEKPEFIKFLI